MVTENLGKLENLLFAGFAAQNAILLGLISQGAVERTRLIEFLQSLVDDLSAEERHEAYGFLLGKTIETLSKDYSPKPPSRFPAWFRGTIPGGRPEDDDQSP